MSEKIPFQHSERMFRRYEGAIYTVVRNWPAPSFFSPGFFSPQTFMCRLRDAMNSLLIYKWTSIVDPSLLEPINKEKTVTLVDGMIRVGPREKGSLEVVEPEPIPTTTSPSYTVHDPTDEDVQAFAHLLGRRRIVGPVVLINATEDSLTKALSNDIAISEVGPNKHLMR
jgi:hypothetical protein